jgi:hypothetical protein
MFGLCLSTVSFLIQANLFASLGLASFLIGLLLIYVPTERTVSPQLVNAICLSSLVNLNSLLEELGVDSKAVYLPTKKETHQPCAFLPLARSLDLSSMFLKRLNDGGLFIVNDQDPYQSGLALVPPGSSLATLIEQESGIDFYNVRLDELENALRTGLVEALEIAEDVRVMFMNGSVRVEVGPLISEELCEMQSKVARSLCSQVGCPLCSAVICAVTKAAKRPVSVIKISPLRGRKTSVELRLLEGDHASAND